MFLKTLNNLEEYSNKIHKIYQEYRYIILMASNGIDYLLSFI